jgi:beta-lactamase class A
MKGKSMAQIQSRFLILTVMICLLSFGASGETDSLRTKINRIIASAKGRVGVAVIGLKENDTLTFNGTGKFPMFSVFKFPIALAVLDKVDKGKLLLTQKVNVRKKDLPPNTWSPLRDKYPRGNKNITIDELLINTVSLSDNNGADILLRLLGGPDSVNQYIQSLGIHDVVIAVTEQQMASSEGRYLSNWSTPFAMTELLRMFYAGKILSPGSTGYLWKLMVNAGRGRGRIKGLLPEGTVVAHKPGTSGMYNGISIATNDVGIVMLPNGKNFAIAAFVAEAPAEEDACEAVIARISRAVWEYYLMQ